MGSDMLGRGYPPVDRSGEWTMPRTPNWIMFMRAIPGLAEAFSQQVPGNFWTTDQEGEVKTAIVACPCGEEPKIASATCEECKCGRFYLFTGAHVRVHRPDNIEAGVPGGERPPEQVVD